MTVDRDIKEKVTNCAIVIAFVSLITGFCMVEGCIRRNAASTAEQTEVEQVAELREAVEARYICE